MKIITGSRRLVFVFDNFVVKIPKATSWISFLYGVMENLHERYWFCADGIAATTKEAWMAGQRKHLARIYYSDRFGFFVIMEKAEVYQTKNTKFKLAKKLLESEFENTDLRYDIKIGNVGERSDGTVVMVDYGYFASINWCYIGRKILDKR